jgi:hypothetical protein
MCAERRGGEGLLAHRRPRLRWLLLRAGAPRRFLITRRGGGGGGGEAVRPQLRLTDSPGPPPFTPSQASPASRRSSVGEEVKDAKVEDAKVEDGEDGEDKDGEDAEDETLNTPPQDAPASLLAAFYEEADEADAGCAERAGALGRAEASGAEWAWRAEEEEGDAGEDEKARGPGALLLRDVDLRGLEFSEQVGPSMQPPFSHRPPPPPAIHTHPHPLMLPPPTHLPRSVHPGPLFSGCGIPGSLHSSSWNTWLFVTVCVCV